MSRSRQAQKEKLRAEIEAKRARLRQLEAIDRERERKARTRRLIEVGAIAEQATGIEADSKEQRAALSDVLARALRLPGPDGRSIGQWVRDEYDHEIAPPAAQDGQGAWDSFTPAPSDGQGGW